MQKAHNLAPTANYRKSHSDSDLLFLGEVFTFSVDLGRCGLSGPPTG